MEAKKLPALLLMSALMPAVLSAQIDFGPPSSVASGGAANAKVKNWMAIGVNPSNLGWDDNGNVSVMVANVGLDAQARALDYNTFHGALVSPTDSFSNDRKQTWEKVFTQSPGMYLSAQANWLSASLHFKKVGGFAVSMTDKVYGQVKLSPEAADVLFNGINSSVYADNLNITSQAISKELSGTSIFYTHYREMNLDYGKKIFHFDSNSNHGKFDIFGGIGVKYIWGLANINTVINDDGIDGHSSLYNPNFGKNFGDLFSAPGHGMGLDLGTSATYKKWRFSMSVTDIGAIKWQNNQMVAIDTTMPTLSSTSYGINSWQNASFPISSVMHFEPGPDYTTYLPTKFTMGADFRPIKKLEFSSDIVCPLNRATGNIPHPYISFAGEVFGILNVDINAGVAFSSYGTAVPMGFFIGPAKMYIGTADILSLLGRNKNTNLSAVVGVFRFDI